MPGVGRVLLRRAIALGIALVLIVSLTAIIMEGTGYSIKVLKAIIDSNVRAYYQQLRQRPQAINQTELERLVNEYRSKLEEIYGINKPWYVRAGRLIWTILSLDFSYTYSDEVASVAGLQAPVPVSSVIMACLPRTIVMLTVAQIIVVMIALLFAPTIAYKHGSLLDRAVVTYAALFNAIPVWWLGMVFIQLFSFSLGIFPNTGRPIIAYINRFWQDPFTNLVKIAYHAALPIITIVIAYLGSWFYSIRAMVLRVVREDFVMVAKAKGLPDRLISRRYILRVVAPPVTTSVILSLAYSIGGFIITESVFDWPGMGSLYYAAIVSADVATVLALTYVTTAVYVIARFILEVLYIYLDPRVRLG